MKKTIKLPAPQLSQLKEVNIDLDMSGRHYAMLASYENQLPEDLILSILKDLMEEDANKLTLPELRYLFMLVKINSLENKYSVNVKCTCKHEDGTECGHMNKFDVFLSDADLNETPSDYQIPEIEFIMKKNDALTEKKYQIIPPTMNMESHLYNYFLLHRDATPEKISESKELSFEYTFLRALLHLVDSNGERVVTEESNFEDLMQNLDLNKFQTITHFYDKVIEVDGFGVQDKVYNITCKECGGTLVFQLPLLSGLLD